MRPALAGQKSFLTGESVPRASRGSQLHSWVRKSVGQSLFAGTCPLKSLVLLLPGATFGPCQLFTV